MEYLHNLFYNVSVTQSLLVLMCVIALGIILGDKIKIKGMTFGVTWILFLGIFFSAVGMSIEPKIGSFAKDFGLVLFVYSIGLQVGPSFFSSLGKGGLKLNLVATGIVLLAVGCTIALKYITGEDMATMVGVMSGAVTNTPSLGSAEQAFSDLHNATNPNIPMAYAVAYPLGVVGIILSIIIVKGFVRVNMKEEEKNLSSSQKKTEFISAEVRIINPNVENLSALQFCKKYHLNMVISRIIHLDGTETVVKSDTPIHINETIRVVVDPESMPTLELMGEVKRLESKVQQTEGNLVVQKILVTRSEWNGTKMNDVLSYIQEYGVTLTRVCRSGVEFLAFGETRLLLGDYIVVIGKSEEVQKVAKLFGNELKKLDAPHIVPIFLGIALGVIFGLMPITIPGLSNPFKLGLAGTSLIVALLMGRFGASYGIVTFSTASANMMLREVGLALFLASVGLGSGNGFIDAIVNGGYMWLLYGLAITMIPLLIMGIIAYKVMHINYLTLMGVMAGATTDPPALGYTMSVASGNDQPSVGYATVYPLTMFLRVLMAQLMVLTFC